MTTEHTTPTTPAPAAQDGFVAGLAEGTTQLPDGSVMTGVTPAAAPAPTNAPAPVEGAPANNGGTAGVVGMSPEQWAMVEQARREEKEKLYPQIQEMSTELKALRTEREAREKAAHEAEERAAEEARRAEEEKMTAAQLLDRRSQEWAAQQAELQTQLQATMAAFEFERQLSQVTQYRSQAMESAREEILPELQDLVVGTTTEEIDQSIASLKQRSAAILGNVQAAVTQERSTMQGARVTAPPVGPPETNSSQQPVSAADIAAMDPATYAKHRDALHASLRDQVAQHGIYGTR